MHLYSRKFGDSSPIQNHANTILRCSFDTFLRSCFSVEAHLHYEKFSALSFPLYAHNAIDSRDQCPQVCHTNFRVVRRRLPVCNEMEENAFIGYLFC